MGSQSSHTRTTWSTAPPPLWPGGRSRASTSYTRSCPTARRGSPTWTRATSSLAPRRAAGELRDRRRQRGRVPRLAGRNDRGRSRRPRLAAMDPAYAPEVVLSINFHRVRDRPLNQKNNSARAPGRRPGAARRRTRHRQSLAVPRPRTGVGRGQVRRLQRQPQPHPRRRHHRHLRRRRAVTRTHRVYLEHLGGDMASPDTFLRAAATATGEQLGVDLAASFEIIA